MDKRRQGAADVFIARSHAGSGTISTIVTVPIPVTCVIVSQPYLRRLVYEKYFKKEAPLPDEAQLVLAIEGFGPYRPMQVPPYSS
jgi:hypothetical protein